MSKEVPGVRYAEVERETDLTRVRVVVDLDGGNKATVDTGIGYFDQLLSLFSMYGRFDLGITAEGDLAVDDRNTLEDVGACFGKALRQAIGDPNAIARIATDAAPQDGALVMASVDLSGRAFLGYDIKFTAERLGGITTECIEDFLRAVALSAGATIHIRHLAGTNNHHLCEAMFKALGLALSRAVVKTETH